MYQYGQVIDILVSKRRDGRAARRFIGLALATLKMTPSEVVTVVVLIRLHDFLHARERDAFHRVVREHAEVAGRFAYGNDAGLVGRSAVYPVRG